MSGYQDSRRFQPGDHVRWYANVCRWKIARRMIIVEGETDSRYLGLAAELYNRERGGTLLDRELGVAAAGFGDEGGTFGIVEKFPAFQQIIQRDCGLNGKPLFRAIALLDNDDEGNNACNYLTNRYTNLQRNRDVFVLQRVFPRNSQQPRILSDNIKQANARWHALDCEIEDLLSRELLDVFVEDTPGALRCNPIEAHGAHHFEFTASGKSALCRWVAGIARCKDVELIVELIKSLRYYLGLNPEGC